MMLRNLSERQITLETIHDYPDLKTQEQRYTNAGYTHVHAQDLNEFWDTHVSKEEKDRIQKLEMLDEVEEWRLFGEHYCLVFAQKSMS